MLRLCHKRISWFCWSRLPRCLVLHPIGFPNKGLLAQQYLAQQAIGLASSLNWEVVRGPFGVNQKVVKSDMKSLPLNTFYMEPKYGSQIKDGSYIKSNLGSGVFYKDGILFDGDESETDGDLHEQWQNKELRESLAVSSMIKCRKITQKYYFTKGKMQKVIDHIVNTKPNCLFINAELKPGQVRNLKKLLESQLNNRNAPKGFFYGSTQENESQTQFESTEDVQPAKQSRRNRKQDKKIQIFDRFSIILQIFARRTSSKLAKLQVQLSYLSYLKTRLVRQGSTYSSNLNIFSGDLLNNNEINLEIISAKQRRAIGTMSGEGESQLQIERRNIKNKEAKIRKEIEIETKLRQNKKQKDRNKNISFPIIALVGYTNVGKSAFMNFVMGKQEVQSKDLLFQTLKTTSRQIQLPTGTHAILMDTIGFISDLPVEMIDSFKVTLEDIAHADLVIHLRDLSHPQHQLQKQSVIGILKDLEFSPDFYMKRMIQVWNKSDLVGVEALQVSKDKNDGQKQPQFRVSCKTGSQMTELMTFIDKKIKQNRGLVSKTFTYGFDGHHLVVEWLRKNANVSYNLNEVHDYVTSKQYPKGSVTVTVDLDQINYNKLVKFVSSFSNKEVTKDKSKKGLPPKEGW